MYEGMYLVVNESANGPSPNSQQFTPDDLS